MPDKELVAETGADSPDGELQNGGMPSCPRCERDLQMAGMTPEYIAGVVSELPVDSRIAPPPVYEARLAACAACDALRSGMMCSWCGCYVALRARPVKSYCPYPGNDRWQDAENI